MRYWLVRVHRESESVLSWFIKEGIEMGVVGRAESRRAEIEEIRRMLVAAAGIEEKGRPKRAFGWNGDDDLEGDDGGALVCVTCGVSYLGLALLNQLLLRGYSVRITVHNPGSFLFSFTFLNSFCFPLQCWLAICSFLLNQMSTFSNKTLQF